MNERMKHFAVVVVGGTHRIGNVSLAKKTDKFLTSTTLIGIMVHCFSKSFAHCYAYNITHLKREVFPLPINFKLYISHSKYAKPLQVSGY